MTSSRLLRSAQSIKVRIRLLVGLLIAVVVGAGAIFADTAFTERQQAARVLAITRVSRDLFTTIQTLRYETGTIDRDLVVPGPAPAAEAPNRAALRARTNRQLNSVLAQLRAISDAHDPFATGAITRRLTDLERSRAAAELAITRRASQPQAAFDESNFAAGDRLADALDDTGERLSAAVNNQDAFIAAMLDIGQLAWQVRQSVGDEMLLLNHAAARRERLSAQQQAQFNVLTGRAGESWEILKDFALQERAPPALLASIATAERLCFDQQRRLRLRIFEDLSAGKAPSTPETELRPVDQAGVNSVMAVAGTAFDLAEKRAEYRVRSAERMFYGSVFLMFVALGFGVWIAVFISRGVLLPIGRITTSVRAVVDGDFDGEIPDVDRPDEVGELARALGVFRENARAREQLNDELVQTRVDAASAKAAAAAKGEFMANMSHEIRTPLTGILGFAAVLESVEGLPAQAQTYVHRIVTSGQALLAVVNDILDFSKLEADRLELDRYAFDPVAVTGDALELIRAEAARKGLSLRLEVEGALPPAVHTDGARFRQVLLNLATNAVKFTEAGGVVVKLRHSAEAGGRLHVQVIDTGVGIPKDRLGRLFQRFSQVDGSITRRFGGTGLGLAICRRLTEVMGGEIGVESREGQGSTFWFAIDAPACEPAASAAGPDAQDFGAASARILVVDDVSVNRELVRAMLSPFGYDLVEAASGAEAVTAAMAASFDMILMDLQMPGMDGLSATRAIRQTCELNRLTPIVALSANVLPHHLSECAEAGMNDHVAKPINPAELLTKIAQWAGPSEAEAGAEAAAG